MHRWDAGLCMVSGLLLSFCLLLTGVRSIHHYHHSHAPQSRAAEQTLSIDVQLCQNM
jgi:hypothetical protein